MTPTEFAFTSALLTLPTLSAACITWGVGRIFKLSRTRPKLTAAAGACLGLLLLPFAMVIAGTIGGSYWEVWGLPGGPLAGVVLAVASACATGSALLFTAAAGSLSAVLWAKSRCPRFKVPA